jgi:uncharacterized membrane protein
MVDKKVKQGVWILVVSVAVVVPLFIVWVISLGATDR